MTQRALLLSTALATMVSFAGFGSTASAADAPTVIEEIVVTAQKFAQRLQDVPASVSAIGGETLQEKTSGDCESPPPLQQPSNALPGCAGYSR